MDLIALILASLAALCFLANRNWAATPAHPRSWNSVHVGLALFVVAFICQWTLVSGITVGR